jgi:DNA adenine methylase
MDSFIKYYGGKSRLRNEIISMMPVHKTYVEVFSGASWLLFSKPTSQVEVINDIDNEIINLYLVVKNQLNQFKKWLDLIPISESIFNMYVDHKGIPNGARGYTKIESKYGIPEMAAKTYYILMNSFNGKYTEKPIFSIDKDRRSAFVRYYNTDWNKIQERLKEVTILNRDFKNVIEKYDSKDTLFYLDPPYLCASDNKKYYNHTFSKEDHELLKVYLDGIRGKFILSYGNDKKILSSYNNFKIKKSKIYPDELLIYNYEESEFNYYFTNKGIPLTAVGIPNRSSWKNSNCPYCNSREVQQVSKRVTLKNNSRNWVKCGFVCRKCKELFRRSPQGIP